MKKQPTNEQILKKIKEIWIATQSLDERLSEVEWIIEKNKHYNEGHISEEYSKQAQRERELAALEKQAEEGDEEETDSTGAGQALEYIDEMDYGTDIVHEVGRMVDVMSKSKLAKKPEFKGPLDALRKMTR